jgi:hypothetical protein
MGSQCGSLCWPVSGHSKAWCMDHLSCIEPGGTCWELLENEDEHKCTASHSYSALRVASTRTRSTGKLAVDSHLRISEGHLRSRIQRSMRSIDSSGICSQFCIYPVSNMLPFATLR